LAGIVLKKLGKSLPEISKNENAHRYDGHFFINIFLHLPIIE